MADQVLSSLSNVLVVLAVARSSEVDMFGRFALAYTVVTAGLAVARGCLGTPLLLQAGAPATERQRSVGLSMTAGVALGLAFAIAALATLALSGDVGLGWALAVGTMVLVVQDVLRFALLSAQRPAEAAAYDALWAVVAGGVYAATVALPGTLSPTTILLFWAGGGLLSAIGLAFASRATPSVRGLVGWWREDAGHRVRFGLEAGIGTTASLLVLSVATWLVGPDSTAALRGAATLMGPLSLLMAAIPLTVIPRARAGRVPPAAIWRRLRVIAAGMSAIALLVGVGAALLPKAIGQLLLGPSWEVTSHVLPFTGLEYAGVAWLSVMYTLLRAVGRSDRLLRHRILYAVASVVATVVAGVVWQGTRPIAAGLALAAVSCAAVLGARLHLTGTRFAPRAETSAADA